MRPSFQRTGQRLRKSEDYYHQLMGTGIAHTPESGRIPLHIRDQKRPLLNLPLISKPPPRSGPGYIPKQGIYGKDVPKDGLGKFFGEVGPNGWPKREDVLRQLGKLR